MSVRWSNFNNDISFLDIAAVIARFWVLLLTVPILVGAAVFAGLQLAPIDRYESNAILQISASEAALLRSSRVIDPALRESGWLEHFGGTTAARRALSSTLAAGTMANGDYYRVNVVDRSAAGANRLLDLLVAELIANSAPRGNDRAVLEHRLETLEQKRSDLIDSLNRMNALYDRIREPAPGRTVVVDGSGVGSLVSLINNIGETERQIFSTRLRLEGSVSGSDIIQEPTLTDAPLPFLSWVFALVAAMTAAFIAFFVVVIYSSLRNASQNPRDAEKVEQIKNAFRFRKVSQPHRDLQEASTTP